MIVVVQHIDSRLYLARDGSWVPLDGQPATFRNAFEAITHCIRRRLRSIRLVSHAGVDGKECYVYPFGEDPAIKAERKKLRRQLAEHRRLNQERRLMLTRIDLLRAEAKDRKNGLPFKRKEIAQGG